ncbi:MAG: glycogen/starch synthase [bacterium]
MKILYIAAEVGPFVSVGGLSQVLYFLPRAIAGQGNSVAIFTPKFGTMEKTAPTKKGWKLKDELFGLKVPVGFEPGDDDVVCNIKSYVDTKTQIKTFFLENQEYYELRANVFGYKDDHVRFLLMCKGCLEWLLVQKEQKGWWPDVIHCNDWHASYFVELARTYPRYKEILKKITIGLTVHNFTYQGNYDYRYCAVGDRDNGKKPLLKFFDTGLAKQNPLLRAIGYADAVTTVSPTHAREVLTAEYGEGLDSLLRQERAKLSGILNGLDVIEFDPSKDPLVLHHFDEQKFSLARLMNKRVLQDEFGLPHDDNAFLMSYSGRLSTQKGISLLVKVMEHLLPEHPDFQLIVLGGGDDSYRKALTELAQKYPKQVGLHLLPNFKLPRKIFAGTDALLIPSLFEPGGIVALEALRYGAVPIVRRTGGLNDIIVDFDPVSKKGNGFAFMRRDAWAFYGAIIMAATTFRNKSLWTKLVANGLEEDFSWEDVAKKYKQWYSRMMETRKRILDLKPHIAYKQIAKEE